MTDTRNTCRAKSVKLTPAQEKSMQIANVAFMNECPFYAVLAHDLYKYVYTMDTRTLATDGKHIIINPVYMSGLKVGEQVFALAHELEHMVGRHPQRVTEYGKAGFVSGTKGQTRPFNHTLANIAADYVINANILKTIPRASINPDWLYDPKVKGDELWEDVYIRLFDELPPPPPGPGGTPCPDGVPGGGGKSDQTTQSDRQGQSNAKFPTKRWRDTKEALRGQQGDPVANAQGGRFDDLQEPPRDPGTGMPDLPDPDAFKDAVARAAAVAKAMGNLPASIKRMVDEILEPKVDWREHVRMLVAGKIGSRHETWARPNRRRLVLNPIVITPGKKGYGANRVVIGVDTSGSIAQRELEAFFAEIGGVLNDCKPREIVAIGCDASVKDADVHTVSTLDELDHVRMQGLGGGGGTDFRPVFDYVSEHDLRPEVLIYLTDMEGRFPSEKPPYDVIWCATTDQSAPFGEHVRLKV